MFKGALYFKLENIAIGHHLHRRHRASYIRYDRGKSNIEAPRSGPNTTVDCVARWVLGLLVRKLSLVSLHHTLFTISFTVAEVLDEDTETVCILHSVVLIRPTFVTVIDDLLAVVTEKLASHAYAIGKYSRTPAP